MISTTSTTGSTTTGLHALIAGGPLEPGQSSAAVRLAQKRLLELGYWIPAVSGVYDELTVHAVTAFEKLHDLDRDGALSVEDLRILDSARSPEPRTSSALAIEVNLDRQVLLVVRGGETLWVLDTSTGSRPGLTPTGSFSVFRQIDGIRVSALGRLYRPKYVVGGVAIHGYPSVPNQPASHGCIRLTNDAMDFVWSEDLAPVGTPVFIYHE